MGSQSVKAYLVRLGIVLSLGFSSFVYGAEGSLSLKIIDAQNSRPLKGAEISVTNRGGEIINSLSDESGGVRIELLPEGLYEVEIRLSQYATAKLSSLRVLRDKTSVLTVELSRVRSIIEETIVIGTTSRGDDLASVGSSVIDREALRSAAGSGSDVLRALDGLPGLFSSGDFASFTVRGNGPRDNLILVDGIPFANVVHFNESFGDQEELEGGGRYSVFAPNLISKAEFQPGGWSAAYGGRAGSLLQLEVAAGNPETASYTTRIDFAGIEVGYDGPSKFHSGTSMLFSARKYDFGRFFETIGVEEIGSPELTDIIFKSRSEINLSNELEFLVIYAPESFSRRVENVLASDEDSPGVYEDVELAESDRDNALYAISWKKLIGDNGEWENKFYFRNYKEETSSGEAIVDGLGPDATEADVITRENILESFREEDEIGWRSDFSIDNRFGRFFTGFRLTEYDVDFGLQLNEDWNQYIYEQTDFRESEQQLFTVLTPENFNNRFTEKTESYVAYFDQNVQFSNWDFRFGIRAEHDGFTEDDLIAPRFGLNWQVNPKLRIASTLGRYFQSPLLEIRARDSQNSGLENEIIDQFSLGFKYLISDDLEFFIEPYYQELDQRIVEEDGVTQLYSNAGEGESFGFDTALTRRFSSNWSADISYSYSDARVKDSADGESYDADFSRPHSISIGGVWEINDSWKLSARWKAASGALRDDFIVNENVLGDGQPLRFSKEITEKNSDRYKAFHSLNFRADYRRSFGAANFIAFIDVINVYGAANESNSEFNERTGEDVTEEGETFPLLGLRFEW